MCAAEWLSHVAERICPVCAPADVVAGGTTNTSPVIQLPWRTPTFTKVVDLTHVLSPEFPTYSGVPELAFDVVLAFNRDRKNIYRWLIHEHIGTHIDAPLHFSANGRSLEQLPVETLVAPIAVVDISEKAENDPDAELTPDDLAVWEAKHGPIEPGYCVAMNSGWARQTGHRYRNADDAGVMHFPGIHVEAAKLLLERGAIGIGVDTMSLDQGRSTEFPTHYAWLPANRWAIEGLANLSSLPPVGATVFVGAPKVKGATGGPSRIIALI